MVNATRNKLEENMYHSRNGVERSLREGQIVMNASSLSQSSSPSQQLLLQTSSSAHREARHSSASSSEFRGLEYYNSVFSSSIADTPEERDESFRVRFQVYCIDNGFEDPANSPDGLERDSFDSHSIHSVLTHNATGNAIGTVRLVLPEENGERRVLPVRQIVGALAADGVAPFPIEGTAEISRFSIVKSFRQHTPDQGFEAQLSHEEWRKMLFHLPLGLMKSMVEMSARAGLTHWVAVMEPALLRLLTRLGIHFNSLGSLVDYHGRRQPCWSNIDTLLARVHAERPDVWEVITDGGRLWALPETIDDETIDDKTDAAYAFVEAAAAQAMPERRAAML
jgi:N-acyl amino acid synthase of PEP-CTERM/exosortase system